MKQSEVLTLLNQIMGCAQKVRSNSIERLQSIYHHEPTDEELAFQYPWLFGDKDILTAIMRVQLRYTTEGVIEPLDLYNILALIDKFIPAIGMVYLIQSGGQELPVPDMAWLRGWNEE